MEAAGPASRSSGVPAYSRKTARICRELRRRRCRSPPARSPGAVHESPRGADLRRIRGRPRATARARRSAPAPAPRARVEPPSFASSHCGQAAPVRRSLDWPPRRWSCRLALPTATAEGPRVSVATEHVRGRRVDIRVTQPAVHDRAGQIVGLGRSPADRTRRDGRTRTRARQSSGCTVQAEGTGHGLWVRRSAFA